MVALPQSSPQETLRLRAEREERIKQAKLEYGGAAGWRAKRKVVIASLMSSLVVRSHLYLAESPCRLYVCRFSPSNFTPSNLHTESLGTRLIYTHSLSIKADNQNICEANS